MRSTFCVALLAATLAAGCLSNKRDPKPTNAVPTADFVAKIRSEYKKTNPDVRIGVIDYVLSDGPYLSAGDIETNGLKVDDIVSVIDGEEKLVAHGTIRAVKEGSVYVQFTDVPAGRKPMVGDVVVKF